MRSFSKIVIQRININNQEARNRCPAAPTRGNAAFLQPADPQAGHPHVRGHETGAGGVLFACCFPLPAVPGAESAQILSGISSPVEAEPPGVIDIAEGVVPDWVAQNGHGFDLQTGQITPPARGVQQDERRLVLISGDNRIHFAPCRGHSKTSWRPSCRETVSFNSGGL